MLKVIEITMTHVEYRHCSFNIDGHFNESITP